jgi:DNA polymerase III subunit beta
MKFLISAPLLLEHLLKVNGAIVSKPILPILDHMLFDIKDGVLTISTTDLETSMSTNLNVESKENVTVAIPAKLLIDTLRSLPDQPITMTVNEDTYAIAINTANGKFDLPGQNGIDFPKIPNIESDNSFSMPSNVLLRSIVKTVFATGNDDLRLNLTGVFVEIGQNDLSFVATDANRLVKVTRTDVKPGLEHSFILPKKALNLLKSSLSNDVTPIQLDFNKSNVFFTSNNLKLSCRLIDEKYPDYKAVIPLENNNIISINRIEFLDTVRRVANFSNKTTHQIRVKITGNELVASAEDLEMSNKANEKRTCEYDGEDIEIGFNSKFLIELLTNLDHDQVLLKLSTPNRAGLLVPIENELDEEVLMLIMPMMLNNY